MEEKNAIFNCKGCSSKLTPEIMALNFSKCPSCNRKFTSVEICTTISNYLLETLNIITLKDTKEMLVFNVEEGIYVPGEVIINQYLSEFEDILSAQMPKLILYKIECKSYIERKELNPKEILITKNKVIIFNGKGLKVENFNPKYYCTSKIPVNFDPSKECLTVQKFISSIVEPKWERLIYEMISYTLYAGYPISTFFILYGSGRNGKSKLLSLIENMLGKENFCHIPLQKLTSNSFQLAELYGKRANLFADIPNKPLDESGILKTLTGEDYITVEKKHQNPFSFKNHAKIIYSCNEIPEVKDNTEAFYMRLELINFPYVFDVRKKHLDSFREPDPDIIDKITTDDELSGLLNKCLTVLPSLLRNRCFTSPFTIEEKKRLFDKQSNPIKAFFDECLIGHNSCWITKSNIYNKYCEWCDRVGAIKIDYDVFFKKLKQSANVIYEEGKESIDDNRVAVLRGLCFNPNYFYFNVESEEDKRKGRDLINSCHDKYGTTDFKEQDFWGQIAMDYNLNN